MIYVFLSNGISGERQKYVYPVNISSGTGTVMSGNALLRTMGEFCLLDMH